MAAAARFARCRREPCSNIPTCIGDPCSTIRISWESTGWKFCVDTRMTTGMPHHRRTPRMPPMGQATRESAGWALAVAFLFVALFAAPLAALAQETTASTEPSFSVSSRQTYAPSQQPKIWLTFRQVDRLDFRVYRVKDPIQFFSKLKDAHSFGSEKTELAREKTWLERFHEWKRDLRASIRDFFRSQLSYQTRYQFQSSRVQEQKLKRIPLDVTSY